MKIAIHHHPGSFSERWIQYCQDHNIGYKQVNCYASDIIEQMHECDALMWHWQHADPKAVLFARPLIYSLETMGKKVFPDANTCWHFDDKVGQKYLLEAIGAPLVPSYVFYGQPEALAWIEQTAFPKVFKLRGGAGAANVFLVKTKSAAVAKVKQAFGKGFKPVAGYFSDLSAKVSRVKRTGSWFEKLKRAPQTIKNIYLLNHAMSVEKGYAYFQDFVPGNDGDTRIVVIGDCAFGLHRYCRDHDFRASGSGKIDYAVDLIPRACLKIAFSVANQLHLQCGAFDFIKGPDDTPLIVEISYGFAMPAYDACPGYWDRDLNYHEGTFNPQAKMLELVIKGCGK